MSQLRKLEEEFEWEGGTRIAAQDYQVWSPMKLQFLQHVAGSLEEVWFSNKSSQ